jgi:hypothetical protein
MIFEKCFSPIFCTCIFIFSIFLNFFSFCCLVFLIFPGVQCGVFGVWKYTIHRCGIFFYIFFNRTFYFTPHNVQVYFFGHIYLHRCIICFQKPNTPHCNPWKNQKKYTPKTTKLRKNAKNKNAWAKNG